jgi:cytochrome c553
LFYLLLLLLFSLVEMQIAVKQNLQLVLLVTAKMVIVLLLVFPKIAGQGEGYIYKQLKDFKSGARKDATMAGMVAALKDQDMQDLAAYYSSQTTAPNVAKKDETMLALGKAIYQGGKKDTKTTACIACHGVNGAGIPSAGFPQISFQHAALYSQAITRLPSS